MFEFILTLLLAAGIMVLAMAVGVGVTMPFHGALIRLRANYNPRAVGLEGVENRVGPTLTTLLGTLRRTKRLEGWYGLYKGSIPMVIFTTLVSIASVIFVGGSSSQGPRGTYSVPEAGGIRMGIFTIVLTLITLPMTVIINRSIITPYKLPLKPQTSLRILLTPYELSKPYALYLTPGLLAATFIHSLCVTLLARTVRVTLLGSPLPADPTEAPDVVYNNVSWFWWALYFIYQSLATAWLAPLEVISTRLSVQPNQGDLPLNDTEEGATPEGAQYAGTDEDVIGLRPTTEPYEGLVDCARKVVEEEGWPSLYRGWWWTALSNVLAVVV
ncbi:hypothetical protein TREMEDRAFT_70739 [Tremella mesenterica DSM 1558]|uniref:uncharacterized protein n=1 Tax=Tremella mesenterica (strain ATCC 24925 / CBS 8224 / DSM 1558 / NBRC 9311 / NRRL Y-6157 / RJB 2259-6 / UBC 559-6) TaxID=578456 RepID=UPI0003F4A30A|nr:uncharacterized protein TREMEDRAFT_70739 [Tremella mesenterica DSM 1558]EIW72509.1 hypothetical protein TREMEDRAFT_70739 [Tremella mesenterica DSM 1558]